MRLHQLDVTAFGPFADTVHVDFDRLSDAGLFLLTGPTGAGKTSVLDAVCFALYGVVPGDRDTARHLRSDHAGPDVAPEVVLTLDIGQRTFRFTRSPAWERPKKRGEGLTVEQAHVVVEEGDGSGWTTLATRLDEAGDLVTDLLGMTATQFTQVAMLPQGAFQAFLRASSSDRQRVLQRLFRTERFERVEKWLVERRGTLRRSSQGINEHVSSLVSRMLETSGAEMPEGWDTHDLSTEARGGDLVKWATELRLHHDDERERATERLGVAAMDLSRAKRAHDDAVRRAELRVRGLAARRRLAELDDLAEDTSRRADAVNAHRRAEHVRPLVRRADEAEHQARAATEETGDVLAHAAELLGVSPGELTADRLDLERRRQAGQLALAESALPRERELATAEQALGAAVTELREGADALAREEAELETLPAILTARRGSVEQTSVSAGRVPDLRIVLEAATTAHAAARRVAELAPRVESLRVDVAEALDASQLAREHWLQVREDRINGMASELAGKLAVGCACPVCGSAQHPAPASSAVVVGREREQQAQRSYDEARFGHQALTEALTTAQTELATARAASGGLDVPAAAQALAQAEAGLQDAETAQADLARARADLAEAEAREQDLLERIGHRRAKRADAEHRRDDAKATISTLTNELAALLAGSSASGVSELLAQRRRLGAALDQARTGLETRETARARARSAREAALEAATAAGFATSADALRDGLSPAALAEHEQVLEERSAQRLEAETALDDPRVVAALRGEDTHPARLAAAVAEAQGRRDAAAREAEIEARRCDRLWTLGHDVETAVAGWMPLLTDLEVAASMAAFAEGKSIDNPLRMRLSAYVLSERLRQVIDAANERLSSMSDQRYSLEHRDERGVGEQRGGLSLVVRDDWNGTVRDPATLSGGETFVVSLALALGLADTVSAESGGTDIDTLFIDEGFGSLDADTLEQVMDALDDLRSGGRVVGVVSHVAEMRSRIPARLEVTKERRGSRLSLSAHMV